MAIWTHVLVAAILATVPWTPAECKSRKSPPINAKLLLERVEKLEVASQKCCAGLQPCELSFEDVADITSTNGTVYGGVIHHKAGGSSALFPCRADINGKMIPGTGLTVQGPRYACNVPYDGKETRLVDSGFEVLVSPEDDYFRWLRKTPDGDLPENAIIGSSDTDSPTLYVGRCKIFDGIRDHAIGWVAADNTTALTYAIDHVLYECTDYEVLECSN